MMRFCKVGVVILDRDSLLSISFGISDKFNMSESELLVFPYPKQHLQSSPFQLLPP